ncbi:MAG: hypothetical protein QOD66_1673, partial [Solirubrobacteraceae bacterium]|nr:hypothetical protein [Solirubrobacteraceae bacterium]
VIALRATNTRGETPQSIPESIPAPAVG